MKISYSAIELFKQCPQKYKFQEIDRIKVPKAKEAVFGTVIHSVLKFLHSKEPKFPTKEEMLSFYKEIWPQADKVKWLDDAEEALFKKEGEQLLTEYYNRLDKSKSNVVDLETSFSVILDDTKESHIVKGKIDRIDKLDDGVFEIVDYKTNRKLPSQDSVDNNLQLSIYHLALISRWPNLKPEEVHLSLYFLKHNEKLSTRRSEKQLEETKQDILKAINDIKKSNFSPTPSPLCNSCGYRPMCPIWKHEYEVKKNPLNHEKIKQVVNEYISLKTNSQENLKRIEELKKVIGEFCDQEHIERVFGDDGYVTKKLQKRYSYEIGKIKSILEPLNLWHEVMEIDGKKLNEVVKALPIEVKRRIEDAKKIESEYNVFTVKKEP